MSDLLERLRSALSARYAVESEIGRGGMAVVFLAEDLKHHRKVAIKVLHPELGAAVGGDRFLQEIDTVAGLTHPHVLPLHDSGETDGLLFYVMPYVKGESLRQRLERERQIPVDEAIRITREVADALDHAHRNGVVHRDIKPGNILLEEGHAVVTDFGVARIVGEVGAERVTATGMAVGTPAYMSPEQAAGGEVDEKSDIYALGCVLYEMLAGEPPLIGPTPQAIAARRLAESPTPLPIMRDTVPSALDAAVAKALSKAPADRYQSAREFSGALSSASKSGAAATSDRGIQQAAEPVGRKGILWVAGAAALAVVAVAVWQQLRDPPGTSEAGFSSIAVLPFENRTSGGEDLYFAEGIHDDLLTQLQKIPSLKVISRTSVMQYAGNTEKTVAEIAEELDVDAVLEGGVQRAGDRVRVTVQLIDASTDDHLWAETYDEELTTDNVFAIQSDLTAQIADALHAALTPSVERGLGKLPTQNLEAYDLYSRGRYLYNKGTAVEDLTGAAELFQQAIEEDSTYAEAYVGLALANLWLLYSHRWPEDETIPAAEAAIQKALQLDDGLGEAHSARGWILTIRTDYQEAEQAHLRALDLSPGSALAHNRYGNTLLAMRRFDEMMREMRRAVQLDPLSVVYRHHMIGSLLYAGELDAAIEECEKLIELEPDYSMAYYLMAWAHMAKGEYEEAVAAAEMAMVLEPDAGDHPPMLAYIHAQAGDTLQARRVLAEAEARGVQMPLKEIAMVYGALGDPDRAFEYLDRAYEEERTSLFYMAADDTFAPLHSDPRWEEFMQRLEQE